MAWLLDTNIISEIRKPRPDARVLDFIASQQMVEMYISVVTLAELRYGIELLAEPERRVAMEKWLAQQIRPMFARRILPVTEEIMLRWKIFVESGRKLGHTYSQPDLIIAATAAHHGLTVVTRDTREFEKAGVAVFNPWNS